MTTTTSKIGNRTYEISALPTGERLAARLIAAGFDGVVYSGTSRASGRFRESTSMLYRTTAGAFVIVVTP